MTIHSNTRINLTLTRMDLENNSFPGIEKKLIIENDSREKIKSERERERERETKRFRLNFINEQTI